MKKYLTIISIIVALLCFTASCSGRSIYEMERDAEREELEERYREGIADAQEHIDSLVEIEIWDLEFDIEDKYGIFPEDAIRILENYADGEPVTRTDLNKAIWAISQYYYDSLDIIYGIDDYWID